MTEAIERATAAERRAELDKLVAKHGGTVTPEQVVRFARNPKTALHSYFEWDDKRAGERYRLDQAEQYLRVVATVIQVPGGGETVRVRAFISLPSDRGTGTYRSIQDVMADPTREAECMEMLRREIVSLERRYKHFERARRALALAVEVLATAKARPG